MRQPKLLREDAKKAVAEETIAAPAARESLTTEKPAAKWSMTERRHRVLRLSAQGQSASAIAFTLGMMPGEVDLIINLNRANYSAFAQA